MENYINSKDASLLLNVSIGTINKWCQKGLLITKSKDRSGRLFLLQDIKLILERKAATKTKCRICNTTLNESNHYRSSHSSHGYICKDCKKKFEKENSARRRSESPEKTKLSVKRSKDKLKESVFKYYCCGDIKCKRCGFYDIRALTIDHINGEGFKHKKELGSAGNTMYRWIKKHNYPPGFQVLCMNCQFIKRCENNENN